ncbi:hypothetical protein POM88_030436 [Heracleum sosnowskyi]|uniref:Myb/SANT-like domain-containing protein n=1 Tax=Heracleum sosnowskyi TaxID=360622 RepID=A0AAD8HWG5_9APIA|nr:hypothetical protein POM88_030436 [Heracleum sosnowskyi]
MADSQSVKKRVGYDQWTKEESDILLEIMVDAANQGWRVNRGVFTKKTVLDKILPSLNSKLVCNKNFNQYQSRLKWFRNRWLSYSTLLNFNSDFGYDSTSKRFTAPNEVWDDYLKAHPKNGNLRNGIFGDYEDLKNVIGGSVVAGKSSIGLGSVAEAKKLEAGDVKYMHTDDLNYDTDNEEFVPEHNELSPIGSPEVFVVSNEKLLGKRGRTEYEKNSGSSGNTLESDILVQLTKLTAIFEGVYGMVEKWEHERTYTAWDAVKEVPDLSEDIRLEAFNLIDTKIKNDGFLKMTPEERADWINMMRKS